MDNAFVVNEEQLKAIVEEQEKVNKYLDEIYAGCKAGIYTITKLKGNNNKRYEEGYTYSGQSRGLKEGYSLMLASTRGWFRTSIVRNIKWETDTSGTFDTLNSTYKFNILKND